MADQIDIDIKINMENEDELEEFANKLKQLEDTQINTTTHVDDSEIKNAGAEIDNLDDKSVDVPVDVDDSEVQSTDEEIADLNKSVKVGLEIAGLDTLKEGLSGVKQSVSEIKDNFNEIQQAGLKSQQNLAFLEKNMGPEQAKKTYQDIADIVASMPGDDNTMRSVLSTAQALGNNLKPEEMRAAAGTMADYMSGSATMGKMAVESQQDIMKYLLDGNTAELERGSIVTSQIDKLKEASTFQERQVAMQEVLNELGYGGISQTDTMLNKQAEWEGMIYNSQDALSSMWLDAEQGAMNYILELNEGTDGLVGMGIAAMGLVSPLGNTVMSLGQIGVGLKGLGEGMSTAKDAYSGVKDAIGTARTALDALRNSESITEGVRAALSVATSAEATAETAGAAAKGAAVAPTTALATAETGLLWPILLVTAAVIAVIGVLWYLYNTNETVRNAINGLAGAFMWVGQIMYNSIVSAVNFVTSALQRLWTYITTLGGLIPDGVNVTGNKVIDGIIAVIVFLATLPLQISLIFINVLGQALGFGDNFVATLVSSAGNALLGFVNSLISLPGRINNIFLNVLTVLGSWIIRFVQRGLNAGTSFVNSVRSGLTGIGGAISGALSGVFNFLTAPFKRAFDFINNTVIKPLKDSWNWLSGAFTGFSGYEGFNDNNSNYNGIDTLNDTIVSTSKQEVNTNTTVNNNFNGLMVESMADYIVDTVNDRLRREKLLKGA